MVLLVWLSCVALQVIATVILYVRKPPLECSHVIGGNLRRILVLDVWCFCFHCREKNSLLTCVRAYRIFLVCFKRSFFARLYFFAKPSFFPPTINNRTSVHFSAMSFTWGPPARSRWFRMLAPRAVFDKACANSPPNPSSLILIRKPFAPGFSEPFKT